MKKILLSLLILLSSALLIGCQLFGGVDPPEPEKPENLIYDSETELSIILGEGVENADVAEIWDALGGFLDKFPVIADDSREKGEHEIIIGRTNREISETAYLRLDRLSRDRESDVGFLVYSDGASLAIAFAFVGRFFSNSSQAAALSIASFSAILS